MNFFDCFATTVKEIANDIRDDVGDLFGTSKFSKERKIWKNVMRCKLTRYLYNENKHEFTYRNNEEIKTLSAYREASASDRLEMMMDPDSFVGLQWPKAMHDMEYVVERFHIPAYDLAA